MAQDQTQFQVRMIMKENRDGSPDRQKARHSSLMRSIRQLQSRGYGRRWDVRSLGKREVTRLVHDWRSSGLSHRTIANRLVDIRWLAGKLGREDLIPSNRSLGVSMRKHTPGWGQNKARELDRDALRQLGEREQLITELRREFGLRCQEALKFQHEYASGRSREPYRIRLAASWCKGGRPREIFITTDRQRDLLDRVGRFQESQPPNQYGARSMIPAHRTYGSYYREYNEARHALDIPGHALRHAWAQERFHQIAGFPAPHAGGPEYSGLDAASKAKWDEAAATVNAELGHGQGRQDITATYIGSKG